MWLKHILEVLNLKDKLWYGHLNDGHGKCTIVAYDPTLQGPANDEVYLFNAREYKILTYKKNLVRPKLTPLKDGDKSILKSIEFAFAKAKSKLYESKIDFPPSFNNDYEPYIFSDESNDESCIIEESRIYLKLLSNSEEEGWFYPDYGETMIDNLTGSC